MQTRDPMRALAQAKAGATHSPAAARLLARARGKQLMASATARAAGDGTLSRHGLAGELGAPGPKPIVR